MEIPEKIKEKIKEISRKKQIDYEEALMIYEDILNDENLKHIDESIRLQYAIKILIVRLMNKLPTKEVEFIPIGRKDPWTTKSGNMRSELYVIVLDQLQGMKKRKIIFQGKYADTIFGFEFFKKYNIKMGEFADGTMVFDYSSEKSFADCVPQEISIDPKDFLKKLFPIMAISDLEPSKTGSDGRVDDFDWKGVEGVVMRKYINEKDGRIISFYKIIDESVDLEDEVLPDGTVVYPGLTVWIGDSMMEYDEEDLVLVFGTVSQDKKNMNGFVILPVL